MHIDKIIIENFKRFKGRFLLELNQKINILVGDNEAGKTTIIEAIHLGLSGTLNGRYLRNELSQYLFNKEIEKEYINNLYSPCPQKPPYISIELFLNGDLSPALGLLQGDGNSIKENAYGIIYRIEFDEDYYSEYQELIKHTEIKTIPIEYYKVSWMSFARQPITTRSIPIKSALINSINSHSQNGSDAYISRIIRDNLEDKEKVEISQAHRQMKENFMGVSSVKAINEKINTNAMITEKKVKISVDLSTQHAWETSLITYLDEIPFHFAGKGEQSIIKTNLALSHKKSQEANIILLEEPENHLSHAKLNKLIKRITSGLEKQIIISTHSSFIANKLGLKSLILLNDQFNTKLNELGQDTQTFFAKLSGYDTLRLILCKKAILVEGDSDELIIQKAYMLYNQNKLPIENGIDVISVGTSFLRFIEIAEKINKRVTIVTDNDGNIDGLKKKYSDYLGENVKNNIEICFNETIHEGNLMGVNYNTLEPNLLKANGRDKLNEILEKEYEQDDDLIKYMLNNKTGVALKIFDTQKQINFPEYILKAIES